MNEGTVIKHTIEPLHCCLGSGRILVGQGGIALWFARVLVCVDVYSREASTFINLGRK